MPNKQVKRPWPGDGCIVRAGMCKMGLSSDRSGIDAIDWWAETATPEELDWLLGPMGADGERHCGYAESLGHGCGLATFPLWLKFFDWLFGNK